MNFNGFLPKKDEPLPHDACEDVTPFITLRGAAEETLCRALIDALYARRKEVLTEQDYEIINMMHSLLSKPSMGDQLDDLISDYENYSS